MDQEMLAPLNQLENSLNALLTSLTNTNTYIAAPGAAQSLLNADDAISTALDRLKQHQENYARILTLRTEANRLETQLKDIVRTCVDFRTEIGHIHPSILEDTDEDEDEGEEDEQNPLSTIMTNKLKREINPIDYEDLLSFAARIGKHNAAAAIEAERQSTRRQTTNPSQPNTSGPNGNNTTTQQPHPNDNAIEDDADPTSTAAAPATQESLAELAAINDTLAQQRAYRGMAFPASEALRMGELGRLQYIREQEGEEAVDREIERLVRESEKILPDTDSGMRSNEDGGGLVTKKEERLAGGMGTTSAQQQQQVEKPLISSASQMPRAPASAALPPKPKKALNLDLDFMGSDDEDDDD